MAGGKENARQKMINLMYLVFIAMLALNMSKEVLMTFGEIDKANIVELIAFAKTTLEIFVLEGLSKRFSKKFIIIIKM